MKSSTKFLAAATTQSKVSFVAPLRPASPVTLSSDAVETPEAAANGAEARSLFDRGRRKRLANNRKIDSLEAKINRAESVLIGLSIAAIASADYLLGKETSIGFLYLIPLSYSALTHSWRVLVALVAVCVVLRQLFGPLALAPPMMIARDWLLTAIFAGVVTFLHRLGTEKRLFFERARQQRDELRRELDLAADVQRNLLFRNQPVQSDWDIAARTFPLKTVGGDYYDFLPLGNGRSGVVIADIAGKGLPAAMLMPAVKIGLRALAAQHERTENVLSELNRTLYEACDRSNYATLMLCSLDPKSRVLRYANAGHNPGLLLRESGQVERLADGGIPVGLLPNSAYELSEIPLHSGDTILLYTDGVTEAENAAGEQFGEQRLIDSLKSSKGSRAHVVLNRLKNAADRFREGAPAVDDLTLIVIGVP